MSGGETPILYAFSLGLIAAFNPCGFPLLPAYVMVSAAEAGQKPMMTRLISAAWNGLCVTVGFVAVFGLIGVLWQEGTRLAYGWLPYVMLTVAAACVALGVIYAAGRTLPLKISRPLVKGRGRSGFLVGFGITYAVASLGCEFPVFSLAVGLGLGAGGRGLGAGGIARGLAFALGMGLIAVAVALVGAGSRPLRARRLVALGPVLQRISGAVLILVGGYLAYYWILDLTTSSTNDWLVTKVERISTSLAGWLSGSPRLVGVILALMIVIVLALAASQGMRTEKEFK